MRLLLAAAVEHDRENPAGAGEIALPEPMSGMAFETGVQDARDALLRFQPARDIERALLMMRKAHAHGAQAPQHLVDVVRAGAAAHRDEGLVQARPAGL